MKNSPFKGDAPFHRKRNLNRVRQLPQGAGRTDAVMISERNEAHQFQFDFNLIALQFKGQFGRQWRRPISQGKIDGPNRFFALPSQGPAQQGPFFSEFGDKEKALFRLIRMTMEGNCRPVLAGDVGLLPNA